MIDSNGREHEHDKGCGFWADACALARIERKLEALADDTVSKTTALMLTKPLADAWDSFTEGMDDERKARLSDDRLISIPVSIGALRRAARLRDEP